MEKEVNELLKEKFLCQNKFTSDIEQLVLTTDLNYIEALVSYCEEKNIKYFDPTFFVVLSMFRSIAILEGVYARFIHGNASSPNA